MHVYLSCRYCLALSLSLALAFCVASGALAQSGAEIKAFHFIGNTAFSDKSLSKLLKAYHISKLSKLFSKKDPLVYDSATVASDVAFLVRHYQREGFLAVKVAPPRVDYDKRKNQAVITLSIAEGPAITTRRIAYSVKDVGEDEKQRIFTQIEKLKATHQLQEGERFRDTTLLVDQDSLRRQMSYLGYPYADPQFDLAVDTAHWMVDVHWQVTPGPLSKFDTSAVTGNQRVSDGMIRKVAAYTAGQPYDQRLVEQTQQQIYGLGMFQIVTTHPQLSDPPSAAIPINIDVREMPRYRAKVGVGYGREDKFRTYIDLYKYGFLGQIRQLRLYARHSSLEPYHVRLTFTQPAFMHPRSVLTITPYIWRQSEAAFHVRRIGSEFGLSHVFTRYLTGTANYVYEGVKLVGSVPPNLLPGDTALGLLRNSNLTSYRKSSVVLSSQFDNSGPLLSPTHGTFGAAELTVSGLGFGSDFHFWKMVDEARRYLPIYRDVVLAGRLKVGGIGRLSSNTFVPLEERLFSGGASSVRGWARQELGPKVQGVPTGGRSVMEGNLEVRFPIYGMFSGAVFTDFGNVWLNSFTYHLSELRYALGAGLRVSTPIGPVRIDFARPVWDVEKKWQVQLSIGQAF